VSNASSDLESATSPAPVDELDTAVPVEVVSEAGAAAPASESADPSGDMAESAAESTTEPAAEASGAEPSDEPSEQSDDAVAEEPGGTVAEEPADDLGEEPPAEQPAASNRADLGDPDTLRAAVESVLFVSDAPVSVTALASGLQRPAPEIQAALAALASDLDARGSGIELREVGDGVRLYTRPELAGWIEAFLMDGQRVRLTQAALETLAVIAYRQPVTRARISAIRGVNVDGVVRTLITRGLITEVGADPDTGGGLYRTTELFLERMGLRSIDELPSLAPLLPELSGLESDELSG
jgi:segregation and condensation protein B